MTSLSYFEVFMICGGQEVDDRRQFLLFMNGRWSLFSLFVTIICECAAHIIFDDRSYDQTQNVFPPRLNMIKGTTASLSRTVLVLLQKLWSIPQKTSSDSQTIRDTIQPGRKTRLYCIQYQTMQYIQYTHHMYILHSLYSIQTMQYIYSI